MMNEICQCLNDNFAPVESSSAVSYDLMEMQSGGKLPYIYEQPDCRNIGHWWDLAACAAFVEALHVPGGVVLDVGPGDGWPSLCIAPHYGQVIGIDSSQARVEAQSKNAKRMGIQNCDFRQMDVTTLDFPDSTFDGVVAASSIEQSSDPARALKEVMRVLKPGSRLVMSFENYEIFGPEGESSSETEVMNANGEFIVVYTYCRRNPDEEWKYFVYFGADVAAAAAWKRFTEEHEGAMRGNSLQALTEIKQFCHRCLFYKVNHSTSSSLNVALEKAGFSNIKGFSLSDLQRLALILREINVIEQYASNFTGIANAFGILRARRATPGAGDIAIATKP